jgi:hypothetical protein
MAEKSPDGASEPQRPGPLPWPGAHLSLSIADGFKFGCGLILAGATAAVLLVLFVAVAFVAARFTGNDVSLPPGIGTNATPTPRIIGAPGA